MSWITESLLLNRFSIRELFDPEEEVYNDLLLVESMFEKLVAKGTITEKEALVVNLVIESGGNFSHAAKDSQMDETTISFHFHNACNKVSFFLGGMYTDEGYKNYIIDKYNLTRDEAQRMIDHMKSEYRHKINRKQSDA